MEEVGDLWKLDPGKVPPTERTEAGVMETKERPMQPPAVGRWAWDTRIKPEVQEHYCHHEIQIPKLPLPSPIPAAFKPPNIPPLSGTRLPLDSPP